MCDKGLRSIFTNMYGKRTSDRDGKQSTVQKRSRVEPEEFEAPLPRKTAIEVAMEEAEEYERQKETEQRRRIQRSGRSRLRL